VVEVRPVVSRMQNLRMGVKTLADTMGLIAVEAILVWGLYRVEAVVTAKKKIVVQVVQVVGVQVQVEVEVAGGVGS
jgi:hypothetical protein